MFKTLALAEGEYQFSIDTYKTTKAKSDEQLKLIRAVNQPSSSCQVGQTLKMAE